MNEGALQWQHCHIVERYSSGITEQDAPAWVVQLLLHGEEQPLVDGAWLAELLLELLKPVTPGPPPPPPINASSGKAATKGR